MRVAVVASSPELGLRWPDAAYPAHLPGDLAKALSAAGHEAWVEVLPPAAGGDGAEHAYASAAENGGWLANRLTDANTDDPVVLHAVDPVAGLTCIASRGAVPTPVVLRWGALPAAPGPTERRLRLAALRAADAVVSPSEVLARQARAGGGAGATVIPDGVDCAALAGAPRESTEAPLLVTLSGPGRSGGACAVLESLKVLPDARLVVAGRSRPQDAERTLGAAERAGVADRVEWRGWVPRQEALDLLSAAHVVLAPRPGATSAVAALEAMCRARPVVAADVPVLSDAVAHRTTGLLVRPDDPAATAAAVRSLLSDPFRREAWGHAGQDRVVATYDWRRVVPLLEALYDRAVAASAVSALAGPVG